MVTTRQALSDAGVIRGLIDNQGRLMLQLEEEDQLLAGNGTAPNLSGILDQSIQTLDLTGEDNLDGIRTARRLVRTGLSRLQADWIVVNPEDSEEIDLLKDDNGLYRGGNPIGNFSFDQSIWRLARAESEAMTAGTALVGARAGATVYERQPITVLTADQHSDFFIRNLIVILFEERLAFPVWFPSAFVEVTLADWGS
jgi:HK97 family phage major capsid protein